MSPKDDEAAAAVEGHEEVIAADPQPSPPVDSINPEEAQWELPAERETCERHRQIIARLLFSKVRSRVFGVEFNAGLRPLSFFCALSRPLKSLKRTL